MTEQRKNKQRLGFLGPPQSNHHIPTHWGVWGSNKTVMDHPTVHLHTHSHTNSNLKNNTCTQSMSKCKRLAGIDTHWRSAFSLTQSLSYGIKAVPYMLTRPLGALLYWWSVHTFVQRNLSLWMIGQTRHTSASVVLVCQTEIKGNVKLRLRLMDKCCQVSWWPSFLAGLSADVLESRTTSCREVSDRWWQRSLGIFLHHWMASMGRTSSILLISF